MTGGTSCGVATGAGSCGGGGGGGGGPWGDGGGRGGATTAGVVVKVNAEAATPRPAARVVGSEVWVLMVLCVLGESGEP
jgi:hypothetical protein